MIERPVDRQHRLSVGWVSGNLNEANCNEGDEVRLLPIDLQAGCFEILGLDFMVDLSHKVYLIEWNSNPALYTDT